MTPLEITLLILLATILAFVSGKIPFACPLVRHHFMALDFNRRNDPCRGVRRVYQHERRYVCGDVCGWRRADENRSH